MKNIKISIAFILLFSLIGAFVCIGLRFKNRDNGIVSESLVMGLIGVKISRDCAATWIKVGDDEYLSYVDFKYFKFLCDASQGTVTKFSNEYDPTDSGNSFDRHGWSARAYEYPFDTYEQRYKNIINEEMYYRSFSTLGKSRNVQYLYFFPNSENGDGWLLFKLT